MSYSAALRSCTIVLQNAAVEGPELKSALMAEGNFLESGWMRQAVWVWRTQWLLHFLTLMSCLHSHACHKTPGLRGCAGSLGPASALPLTNGAFSNILH